MSISFEELVGTQDWEAWKRRNRHNLDHPADFERIFVERVLQAVARIEPADVVAQFPFTCARRRQRRVDFMIISPAKGYLLPIELDGKDKGEVKNQWNDFLFRQNQIIRTFGTILRFTNDQMFNETRQVVDTIDEVLAEQAADRKDGRRAAYLRRYGGVGEAPPPSKPRPPVAEPTSAQVPQRRLVPGSLMERLITLQGARAAAETPPARPPGVAPSPRLSSTVPSVNKVLRLPAPSSVEPSPRPAAVTAGGTALGTILGPLLTPAGPTPGGAARPVAAPPPVEAAPQSARPPSGPPQSVPLRPAPSVPPALWPGRRWRGPALVAGSVAVLLAGLAFGLARPEPPAVPALRDVGRISGQDGAGARFLPASQAGALVGSAGTLCGQVVALRHTTEAVVLDLDRPAPAAGVSLVLPAVLAAGAAALDLRVGRFLCVQGKVQSHQGRPYLEILTLGQVLP
ncbi:hypothetical protein [Roseomonas sp. USHLN139]|uniref:hypothetical protein n=1 Tax=Roseomonas sp. USHLN139 TaxID=3081298 RepID=UPI003B010BA5